MLQPGEHAAVDVVPEDLGGTAQVCGGAVEKRPVPDAHRVVKDHPERLRAVAGADLPVFAPDPGEVMVDLLVDEAVIGVVMMIHDRVDRAPGDGFDLGVGAGLEHLLGAVQEHHPVPADAGSIDTGNDFDRSGRVGTAGTPPDPRRLGRNRLGSGRNVGVSGRLS